MSSLVIFITSLNLYDLDFLQKTKKQAKSRVFNKEQSVFKDWKEDTKISMMQAFEIDTHYWKGKRVIKNEDEVLLQI